MSVLQRLIHRTQKASPAIFSNRLFSPTEYNKVGNKVEIENERVRLSGEMSRGYIADVVDMKQHQSCKAKIAGIWSSTRSGVERPMRLKAGWRTTQYHDFLSPSSSSMISSIRLTNIAELSSLSSSTATKTMDDAYPENSKSEATAGEGEAISGNDNGTNISGNDNGTNMVEMDNISFTEVKRLMRLVNVEALKSKLGMEGKEIMGYSELLEACKNAGVARSVDEAITFAQALDEAGVVLLFRDKVYLHPDRVVDLVRRAVPLALTSEDDPRREELKTLQKKKEEIDIQAHNQVRRILWCGLGLSVMQVSLFFRLTFWEFSWDVMEPIAFFATAGGIVVGYAYFLFTSRDPSYQDLRKRLFLSRQRKLFKNQNFDVDRYLELQKNCHSPLEVPSPPL